MKYSFLPVFLSIIILSSCREETGLEGNKPPLAPYEPEPAANSVDQNLSLTFSWKCSDPDREAVTYLLFLDQNPNPTTQVSPYLSETKYSRKALAKGTTYYWKVVAKDAQGGSSSSPVWKFTTKNTYDPNVPSNPVPAHNSFITTNSPVLRWDCTDPDGDSVFFDVYFGSNSANFNLYSSNQKSKIVNLSGLTENGVFYWKIVAKDGNAGISTGPVWSFITVPRDGKLDYNGYSYKTVKIGNQEWTAENLRTKTYNDGTNIPNVIDNFAWFSLTTGAYCSYDHDLTNSEKYGYLYNWYAVNSGKLAPASDGWRIPTQKDWDDLITLAGGPDSAGYRLKGKTGWLFDGNGTDEFGFNALPGGGRKSYGVTFYDINSFGNWWSNSQVNSSVAWTYTMDIAYPRVLKSDYQKTHGYSVRLVRDL